MTNEIGYCCPETQCKRLTLRSSETGLTCPNGHFYPFASDTNVPIFAKESDDTNEYSKQDAAIVHDNALRWVFSTFETDESVLRERLVSRLRLAQGQKLLVTGAGAGNDLPYLVRAFGGQGEIYVQDIALQMLLAGVERYQSELSQSDVVVYFSASDAMNLPFRDDYFDAAYHFGGVNLFPDIRKGVAEMTRVVRPGGRVVVGDEGIAPWLKNTECGRMLIRNNPLYTCDIPLALLPESAMDVQLSWELGNCFYVIEFSISDGPPRINIDVPHVGLRGGSIRTRYFGELEGVDPILRDRIYTEAERLGMSRVEFLELLLRGGLSGQR